MKGEEGILLCTIIQTFSERKSVAMQKSTYESICTKYWERVCMYFYLRSRVHNHLRKRHLCMK